jgi:hypothetical protein
MTCRLAFAACAYMSPSPGLVDMAGQLRISGRLIASISNRLLMQGSVVYAGRLIVSYREHGSLSLPHQARAHSHAIAVTVTHR